MAVAVLDRHQQPLMPCTEKRARILLEKGRARVVSLYPFTIRFVDRTAAESVFQPLRLKIDPGSSTTGMAVVREAEDPKAAQVEAELKRASAPSGAKPPMGRNEIVLFLLELKHQGLAIRDALSQRSSYRRARRGRKTRYRAPRFNNRTRAKGWLPPSLEHRVDSTLNWVCRWMRSFPIAAISVEGVRFDAQLMENPEVAGTEYQQGTLAGYEVREYLLEKCGRCCAYCGRRDIPLQIDHIHPRARGGSNRVSNSTLACECCNRAKGSRPVEEFLKRKPAVLERVLAGAKRSLAPAAAVNATRSKLVRALNGMHSTEESTGGRTKFNRQRLHIPKTHALDAACVGNVETVEGWQIPTLEVVSMGRGAYARVRLDPYGFPRAHCTREKSIFGFQTGDIARAEVPSGKKKGIHSGRVAVRKSGSFDLHTADGKIAGISHRFCKCLQRGDGYRYARRRSEVASPPDLADRKTVDVETPTCHEGLCVL